MVGGARGGGAAGRRGAHLVRRSHDVHPSELHLDEVRARRERRVSHPVRAVEQVGHRSRLPLEAGAARPPARQRDGEGVLHVEEARVAERVLGRDEEGGGLARRRLDQPAPVGDAVRRRRGPGEHLHRKRRVADRLAVDRHVERVRARDDRRERRAVQPVADVDDRGVRHRARRRRHPTRHLVAAIRLRLALGVGGVHVEGRRRAGGGAHERGARRVPERRGWAGRRRSARRIAPNCARGR